MPRHIQSFISNISFPKTLEELYWFATEEGSYNVEDVLEETWVEWTCPAWAKIGDIVFFMHAQMARASISRLKTELRQDTENWTDTEKEMLMLWLERGSELYKKYGGKIFAIGVVTGSPTYDSFGTDEGVHWHSRIYAEIKIIAVLHCPLPIAEFRDFIQISRQNGITPVVGNDFAVLRSRISQKNTLPQDLWECDAVPLPLTKVNDSNWFQLTNTYRRGFLLEIQFRHFYVDYLLRCIGDQKTFFSECRCIKKNHPDSFADNVIRIGGRFLPVEVKLSVSAQRNLQAQVQKYCEDEEIVLDSRKNRRVTADRIHSQYVLIVDTENLYLYANRVQEIEKLFALDDITNESKLEEIRFILLKKLK